MADLRCPNCGKDNPDFLSVCQFCQSPLVLEPKLQFGDKPTKKTTGELEPVLPDWLRDVRQQAREAAEEDAAHTASMPKTQKEEPPDLLAGLAFQSDSNEDEVPDWLASLTPKKEEKKPAAPPAPEPDFFAQLNQNASPFVGEPEEKSPSASVPTGQPSPASDSDELSAWFAQAAEEPAKPFTLEPDSSDLDLKAHLSPGKDTPPPEAEDLGWLRSLETESRKTGELSAPKQEDWSFDPDASSGSGGADLSWLNELGSIPLTEDPSPQPRQPAEDLSWLNQPGSVPAADEPAQPKDDLSWLNAYSEPSTPAQPGPSAPASQGDLSWLNDLGSFSESKEPTPSPAQSHEDLSWLSNLGSAPTPEEPVQPPARPHEDLSWLNNLGSYAAPEETVSQPDQPKEDLSWLNAFPEPSGSPQVPVPPPAAQEDLSWLNDLGAAPPPPSSFETQEPEETAPVDLPHVSPFTPRQTAPLEEGADPDVPDWLKNATEEPSMPLGAQALDQFREDYKIPTQPEEPFSWKSFVQGIEPNEDQPVPSSEPSTLSNQDVDSLFSMDMPDWLSRSEPEPSEPAVQDIGINAEGGETLTPADLPSWVQAMRPMEAVISDAAPSAADQPAERQGPLAGFRGVIPVAPIGSSRRPQPIPLKLQASEEQQASAALLEQLLLNETTPRPLVSSPEVISQRILRWAIAGLLVIVLGAVVFLRTQVMPVSTVLPANVADVSNVVAGIAEDAPVLVILDYEPALAGEMEASSGPLLDQLVSQRHPHLSFVTTSPSGPALVERLLAKTNINRPEGYGYIAGQNYANMGYLPGGESGVLAFIQSPQTAIPSSPVLEFSEYAAILLLTDHAESARVWVEQLQAWKQADPTLARQPLLAVSSAQAGPMLQPYAQSRQINGLVSGLADAVRYEAANNRPGVARSYWDAFGAGMMLAVGLIVLGGLWSLFAGMRERRAEAVEE